jgi:hypothetical protein
MPDSPDRQKIIAFVAFGTPVVWQLYACITAFRHAPGLISLFTGFGSPLPPVTRYFIATYPYWWVLPTLFAGLSADVLRRNHPPLLYFVSVLVASVGSALTLHAWLNEALFAPLFTIFEKIG